MKNNQTIWNYEHKAWTPDDINKYTKQFKVLILFKSHPLSVSREAELIIYGDFSKKKKELLLMGIISKYGGQNLTSSVCIEINDFAERWHNRYILEKRARVINFKKKRK